MKNQKNFFVFSKKFFNFACKKTHKSQKRKKGNFPILLNFTKFFDHLKNEILKIVKKILHVHAEKKN
jgi:hypothetical protein